MTEGERRKEAGMSVAAQRRRYLLDLCRPALRALATQRSSHSVTADDAANYLESIGIHEGLGPAAGSLFRGKEWEFRGDWMKSDRAANHASDLRVWRLKEPYINAQGV